MAVPVQPLPAPDIDDWDTMVLRIAARRCVPFLGAGVSLGFEGDVGLPTGGQLAEILADQCRFPGEDRTDLFRVAQYFRMVRDEDLLRRAVGKALRVKGSKPSIVHRNLAALPIEYVLTTNFDDLMERAFREGGEKTPRVFEYERRGNSTELPIATEDEPVIYKLHGSLDNPTSMILTEDDVVDFLACIIAHDPQIPAAVTKLFKDYSILFIGYGLKDLNVRVMLRALRGRRDAPPGIDSFAVQRVPNNDAVIQEWHRTVMYFRAREGLRCFNIDAENFVEELRQRYEAYAAAHG